MSGTNKNSLELSRFLFFCGRITVQVTVTELTPLETLNAKLIFNMESCREPSVVLSRGALRLLHFITKAHVTIL